MCNTSFWSDYDWRIHLSVFMVLFWWFNATFEVKKEIPRSKCKKISFFQDYRSSMSKRQFEGQETNIWFLISDNRPNQAYWKSIPGIGGLIYANIQWFCHFFVAEKKSYQNLTTGKVLNSRWPPMTRRKLLWMMLCIAAAIMFTQSIKCRNIHWHNVLLSEL